MHEWSLAAAEHEIGSPPPSPKHLPRWCCTRCGSTRVFCDALSPMNPEDDVLEYDDTQCTECEDDCKVELRWVQPEEVA